MTQCPQIRSTSTPAAYFDVALDAQAFEFHLLSRAPTVRITKLDFYGNWSSVGSLVEAGETYKENGLQVTPESVGASITVDSDDDGIEYLYLDPRVRPKTVLCYSGDTPVVYVSLRLRRQKLRAGTYVLSAADDSFFKTPEGLVLLNVPSPTTKKPSMSELVERSFDPALLYMATRPIHGA